MEKLQQKKILVAGAAGGIGSQTAKLLQAGGAQLYLAGRKADRLHALAASLQVPGHRVFVLDLADEAAVVSMAEAVHAEAGSLDVLVNAAGLGIIKPLEQLSSAEFMMTLQANLLASFFLAKAFLPPMKAQGKGLVINIPGVLGKVPMAGAAAYSASKYGLVGMMQSIREELKRTNVRITNLFLGGVDSPFWDQIELRVQKEKMIRPEEAARAIWFLCQQPESGVVSEMVLQPFNHQAI
jgi:NAD(P)-dependent dehydrogenase (short-subunit alcohol dehydrogenase family)